MTDPMPHGPGELHLRLLVEEYVAHYHRERNHQGLDDALAPLDFGVPVRWWRRPLQPTRDEAEVPPGGEVQQRQQHGLRGWSLIAVDSRQEL